MYRNAVALALAAMLLAAPAAAAQPAPAPPADLERRLDDLVGGQLTDDHIPGAVVTVVADGRVVLSKGYGLADVHDGTPMDPVRTTLLGASEAKVLTAIAAAQLIASGRIDPDADVNRYLTDFTIEDTFPGRPVTMNHLLTHTAGFDQDFVGLNSTGSEGIEALGRSLADKQPIRVRPPGEAMAYDNYGAALAGHLVEVVSGQPFDRYVADHVLRPLGMDSTTFTQPTPTALAARLATGHRPAGTGQDVASGQYGPWTPTGGGTVINAADLGALMLALLGDDPRLGDGVARLVKRQHFTQDPRVPGIGYLLVEGSHGDERVLSKDGDLPGFHHDLALLPDRGVGVYVGFNGDGDAGAAYWDAKVVRAAVLDHFAPRTPSATPDPAPGDVGQYAGSYRASNTSEYSLAKVTALTTPVSVEEAGEGRLRTSGISADPAQATQEWVHVGDGEFAEVGGSERIVFGPDGILAGGSGPEAVVYVPIAWYQSPAPHLLLLVVGVVGLLAGFVWFPVAALVRRRRGAGTTWPLRVARVVAWLNCAVGVAFLVGFVVLVADGNVMNEVILTGSPLLTVLPYLPAAMLVTFAGMVVLAVVGIGKSWWRARGWTGYLAMTVAAAAFLGVCAYYDLLAIGDTVSPGGFHSS
ncbi:serine hydrolase domain-containing protein [Actinophytocola gossypii]|uniref:Beta-lactamase family protein n=1 Tax=Actinophytocola gossypii TaxID=2812003 RepID=A0ABT2J817_9PSEU|nr:serine hydrolase domain-containing protein [Actinophytocola gossypii]MCT2583921.1 beta-lactamase family protein [Actinophytocola gossypii]